MPLRSGLSHNVLYRNPTDGERATGPLRQKTKLKRPTETRALENSRAHPNRHDSIDGQTAGSQNVTFPYRLSVAPIKANHITPENIMQPLVNRPAITARPQARG